MINVNALKNSLFSMFSTTELCINFADFIFQANGIAGFIFS
jgi:hypothetical protein